MKIALCSTYVPFIYGGARNIVDWLALALENAGHQVETIYLPQVDAPDLLFNQMAGFRWIHLEKADRIICFRPQAHLIPHPNKILWFIHHIRAFYDLWDSSYRPFADNVKHRAIRDKLIAVDTVALKEAKHIFTNSNIVTQRLKNFNGVNSEVLYPPIYQSERYYSNDYNNEIVCVCRLEHHKQQHLLIEAMSYTKTGVKLRLCGKSSNSDYPRELFSLVDKLCLHDKVLLENRWISEEEKINIFANCLATAYLPIDEDSYGYPSIEASYSKKAIITTQNSGGVLELVEDGYNGFITEPNPEHLANVMDNLYLNKALAKAYGENAFFHLKTLNVSWDHVLERLLA